jgi:hypothetical protein
MMQEKLFAFLSSPNRDAYFAIRGDVIASDRYNPDSLELSAALSLLDAGKHIEAREGITGSMPNLLLSPAAHQLLSRIAEQLNDQESAAAERAIASLCLAGILTTGDGSREKPYVVLRVSDEYDVINYTHKQIVGQSLFQDGEKGYDQLRCEDGSVLWFDITDAFRRREERIRKLYQVRLSEVGQAGLRSFLSFGNFGVYRRPRQNLWWIRRSLYSEQSGLGNGLTLRADLWRSVRQLNSRIPRPQGEFNQALQPAP